MGKNQHVVRTSDGRWGIRGEGNKQLTAVFDSQQQAIDSARQIAKNQRAELLIHGRDGKIRARDSYGRDPHPPKDSKH